MFARKVDDQTSAEINIPEYFIAPIGDDARATCLAGQREKRRMSFATCSVGALGFRRGADLQLLCALVVFFEPQKVERRAIQRMFAKLLLFVFSAHC